MEGTACSGSAGGRAPARRGDVRGAPSEPGQWNFIALMRTGSCGSGASGTGACTGTPQSRTLRRGLRARAQGRGEEPSAWKAGTGKERGTGLGVDFFVSEVPSRTLTALFGSADLGMESPALRGSPQLLLARTRGGHGRQGPDQAAGPGRGSLRVQVEPLRGGRGRARRARAAADSPARLHPARKFRPEGSAPPDPGRMDRQWNRVFVPSFFRRRHCFYFILNYCVL